MVSLLAKEFEIPAILSVLRNPEHRNLFRRIGVNTMENPQELIAEYLYRSVTRPGTVNNMDIDEDAEIFEISVTEDAPVYGKTFNEANNEGLVPDDVLIVAIEREEQDSPIVPRGNTAIEAGDQLTVYSDFSADPDLTDLFGHYEDRPE